jgi:hypothetical protein
MRDFVLQGNNKNYFRKTCGAIYDDPANPRFLGRAGFPRYNSNHPCTAWPAGPWDRDTYANYYFCCGWSSWFGEFLVLRLLGLESAFATSAIFDLLDRTYSEGINNQAHVSAGAVASWAAYSALPNLCANGARNRCHPGNSCNSLTNPVYIPRESAIDVGPGCP